MLMLGVEIWSWRPKYRYRGSKSGFGGQHFDIGGRNQLFGDQNVDTGGRNLVWRAKLCGFESQKYRDRESKSGLGGQNFDIGGRMIIWGANVDIGGRNPVFGAKMSTHGDRATRLSAAGKSQGSHRETAGRSRGTYLLAFGVPGRE